MNIVKLERAIDETLKRYKKLVINSDIMCSGCVEEQLKQEELDKKKRKEF